MFLILLIRLVHCTQQVYQHLKIIVFWDVQWLSWVHRCQCSRGTCCLYLLGSIECRQHIPLLCWYTCTVLYNIMPRRRYFPFLPRKPQVLHQYYCFEEGSLVMLIFLFHFIVVWVLSMYFRAKEVLSVPEDTLIFTIDIWYWSKAVACTCILHTLRELMQNYSRPLSLICL